MYIEPNIKVHSSFAEAEAFFAQFGGFGYLVALQVPLRIPDIATGTRTLIVGEPGIGKTLLLEKLRDHFRSVGSHADLISLRREDCSAQIDAFLAHESEFPKVLLLDALDEVRSDLFPSVLQRIEAISERHAEMPIYLSARWIFLTRHFSSFRGFRFVTISPFSHDQVRQYLIQAGHSETDIDTLLYRVLPFGHQILIIQVPRYLEYLESFLATRGVKAAAEVSRNDLFEHFIYSRLELEGQKLHSDRRAIIKRVLEKLALTMEIYQTNVISKDELMTFFDDLRSDLKLAAISQIGLEIFYDYSLLKNNPDSIEFQNTEFQEYLAAKEITRFVNPGRAAFAFAVDPATNDIYPVWFNTLTFLVDMQPDLLEQLIDFSGLRRGGLKAVDDAFLDFLARLDTRNVSPGLRPALFVDTLAYHRRVGHWLPGQLAAALAVLYQASLEPVLKEGVAAASRATGTKRRVSLGNIAYVVGHLLQRRTRLDWPYWRSQLLSFARDLDANGVLQRHALFALGQSGDPSVIDELPNLIGPDELLEREFLSACAALDPESPKSLDYCFQAIRKGDFHGRYGLLEMKLPASIERFLRTLRDDASFRRPFLADSSLFRDRDHILVDRIEAVLDGEMADLAKGVIIRSVHYSVVHDAERSVLITGLWKLLKRKYAEAFIPEMIKRIATSPNLPSGLHFATSFLAAVIQEPDVTPFINAMIEAGDPQSAFATLLAVRQDAGHSAARIFEAGSHLLTAEYKAWEHLQELRQAGARDASVSLLNQFRTLLEPAPGQFNTGVFAFYIEHADELDALLAESDRKRITDLLTETIFKSIDPIEHELVITSDQGGARTYRTSDAIHLFGAALKSAKRLGLDVTPFRQRIVHYIPFAYSSEVRIIFDLVTNIEAAEMAPVIEIYRQRTTDVWRHQTLSFVEAVEQYNVTEAAAILMELVRETKCEQHVREKALIVLDTLAPDRAFLEAIFTDFAKSNNAADRRIALCANALLVSPHADRTAIRWRLNEVARRAAPFTQPRGFHQVSDLEDEISHKTSLARPLMQVRVGGYEDDYLELVDKATKVRSRGPDFHAYAGYLWDIVFSYFDNLKDGRSYAPLRLLETRIFALDEAAGVNWLAARLAALRRSYLSYLGRPRSIARAVKRYNDARIADDSSILNSNDLFQRLQDALETDLRQWIEGEGAYDVLLDRRSGNRRRQDERFIQTTLVPQLRYILIKHGFQIDITREAMLLDGKRVDLLIRYGFTGPVVLEVKLTSNSDIKGGAIEESPSYANMIRYMEGYGATNGILLVVANTRAKNLPQIRDVFQRIPNVRVHCFDCFKSPTANKKRRHAKKK